VTKAVQRCWLALVTLVLLAGCNNSGVVEIAIPLEVAGTGVGGSFEGQDGWQIELSRADLAFGPFYLCSGVTAGELCDTARAEWIGSVVVDTLDDQPRRAGHLEGVSGFARSWMYDLGITSLLTQQKPVPLDAAEALDGSSVVLEGTASREDVAVSFRAAIPIQQAEETEIGVPVIRKSTSEAFEHEVTGDESGLLVRFDARPWLSDVDFSSLADGQTDEVTVEPESQASRAIRNAVIAGQRPTFTWSPATTTNNEDP